MVNQEKRKKFMEVAENRVQNVIHTLNILEPMGRSNNYDYTENDVEMMMTAIQESVEKLEKSLKQRFLNNSKDKKAFSFNLDEKENIEE